MEISKECHLSVFYPFDFQNNLVSTFEIIPPIIDINKLFNMKKCFKVKITIYYNKMISPFQDSVCKSTKKILSSKPIFKRSSF